jgi:hypothetical protein
MSAHALLFMMMRRGGPVVSIRALLTITAVVVAVMGLIHSLDHLLPKYREHLRIERELDRLASRILPEQTVIYEKAGVRSDFRMFPGCGVYLTPVERSGETVYSCFGRTLTVRRS